MQEKLTIARPYAAAAFEYAVAQTAVPAWSDMLQALALAVADRGFAPYIGHPKVSKAQLMEVLAGVLGARLSPPGRNFVQALLDAERLELAPEVAELFERRRARAAGQLEVEVTSAYPLSAAEQTRIDGAMRARLGRECKL
jgi:F-type H+-transporting ATPase subunit delta